MSEYLLEITGKTNLSDYSNIYDYIEIVDINDKVTIILNAADTENVDLICRVLEEKYFSISSRGEQADGKFHISAQKRKLQL